MKKGFTLIELLGVIVILGVLVLILFPNILNQVKKSKKVINSSLESIMIEASKDYYEDNIKDYKQIEGIAYCIDLSDLVEKNYLSEKLKDADLNNIDTTKSVKIKYTNNKYQYEVIDNCTKTISRNEIEVPIVTENAGLYESKTEGGRLIYRGEEPNNYIELNEGTAQSPSNILYRIVSFETDGTIKVVRNEKITGSRAWDTANTRYSDGTNNTYCTSTYGCNVWGNQSNTLSNGESLGDNFHISYYTDTTTTTLTSGGEGKVTDNSSLNIYLNGGSWSPLAQLDSYITNHAFNVGGMYYSNAALNLPNSDNDIIREKEQESLLKWTGKVGLLNITEYVEASLNPSCTSVKTNTGASSTGSCNTSNWSYKEYTQWSITPNPSGRYTVWSMAATGTFSNGTGVTSSTYGIRPAFYLKSSIVLTGEGTSTNPYKIQ